MYCPQCGQQQVSDVTRYCSRCGFLLDGVTAVLASGGAVPTRYIQPAKPKLSPRSKGVRQGAMLMLSTILLVPIVAIISVFILGNPEVIIPLVAISLFVGGLLRILYALLMEDAVPQSDLEPMTGYAPAQMCRARRRRATRPCRRLQQTQLRAGGHARIPLRFISRRQASLKIRRVSSTRMTPRIVNSSSFGKTWVVAVALGS